VPKTDESLATAEKDPWNEKGRASFSTENKGSNTAAFWLRKCLIGDVAKQELVSNGQRINPKWKRRKRRYSDWSISGQSEPGVVRCTVQNLCAATSSFFRSRCRELAIAEDLAQEVMLTVYRKAGQVRDGVSFRAWLFRIARNALARHYDRLTREVETINLADVDNRLAAPTYEPAGTPGFEFRDWMAFLDTREREVMMLRFVEQWEYHEIAAAQGAPIGTVQSRVFSSKKKLARHLKSHQVARQAAWKKKE
jgi:RNA polymerase sigma-70 factor (ECF subfamily)